MSAFDFTARATDSVGRMAVSVQHVPVAEIKSLLHFDGLNNSTTFTDQTGRVWTPAGTAKLDTGTKKFGTAAGKFDSGGYISTPTSTAFDFSGDFTAAGWLYFSATNVTQTIYACDGLASSHVSHFLEVTSAGKLRAGLAFASANTTYKELLGTTSLVSGAFYYVELCKSGSSAFLFLNGVLEVSATGIAAIASPKGRTMYIGQYYTGTSRLRAWLDEWLFATGAALHVTNFTPPVAAFPNP